LLLSLLTLSQVAQGMSNLLQGNKVTQFHPDSVGNNLFLGFWTSRSIPGFAQGDYIAVYASLGEDWIPFLFSVLN